MSKYEITLRNCDGDDLFTTTMDVSNKSVDEITDEMVDLWQENQKHDKYSIECTPVDPKDDK